MAFYMLYISLLTYLCWVGHKFVTKNRGKPKFKRIYYSGDEYAEQRDEMELAFEDWNIQMRHRLEEFYRISFTYAVSLLIQTCLIISVLVDQMNAYFLWY